jgi:isopenicillin N synthase-like dioxygenase
VGVPGSRNWKVSDFDESNACLDGFNQFPSSAECPNFREITIQYFDECDKLSNRLARLMARALGIMEESDDAKILNRMALNHTSYLRMNYYPPCNLSETVASDDPPPLGISPHRDAGFLTVLLQDDDCHSLQVARFEDSDLGCDNSWVTINPIPGALTINTGDMAMIWSNSIFRAPLHRVLTDPTKKRYSSPFFYNPGYNELIFPSDCCCREKNIVIKYRPCLWGYFRALRFAGDFSDLGVEIQTSHFKVDSKSDHIEKQDEFLNVVNFEEPFNVEKYRSILESKD